LLYILYGEDDFSVKQALAELKGELGEVDISIFDGQKLSPEELIAACDTLPFLALKRLVIVEGLLARIEHRERRGRRSDIGEWQVLKGYIMRMAPSTVLVLVDGKLGRNNPLLRELAPGAKVREFPPLKGNELRDWILSRVGEGGGDISPAALRLLSNLVGGNLWLLGSEIEKLCLYTHGRRIEEGDVRSLVSYAGEADIFTMVDAIIRQRATAATRLLHQLIDEGAAPPYLLFMVTRQFRLLLQAKVLSSQPLSSAELASRLGLSEYLLPRVLEQTQRHSLERLREVYHRLLDADIAIKTGRLKGELALDLLLTELCHGD
jgi:DNA polymerase-3 subunit delta